ncbi:ELF3-like protein 2 isoform X1 [Senna tora]|uniref:ELF3-like protein 2 isoform X1 n=1 Tax=Senna tora TaxID=362788 RepID=A0A834T2N1_9FABA|nr:ELF3-like protein 2 isoform X1 [Senna tora]
MKGANDDKGKEINKEINPLMLFPRLHIKDAEKGGPKAPPRNKMALYDKLTTPSQTFHSAPSRHVSSSHSTQFGTFGAPTFLTEKIHDYHSGVFNLTYLFQQDDLNHCENSLKIFDGEDALEARDSSHGRNSFYSISLNNNDGDKLKSQKSFRKKVNINDSIELKLDQYGKNQIEEHTEGSQIRQKPIKFRNLEEMKTGHTFFKDEIRNMPGNSSKGLQGSNCQTHEDDATLGDKINLNDGCSRKFFLGKRDRHKIADTYRHYDIPNKPISNSTLGMVISPDDAIQVIGMIPVNSLASLNYSVLKHDMMTMFIKIILSSVSNKFKVNGGCSSYKYLSCTDSYRPLLEVPPPKKLQSETMAEQAPSSIAKLNSTFLKPDTEHTENNTLAKIPLLSVNNISKNPIIQLPNYGHHSGNQWLIPIMSPSEGLVYKPFIGPCPPNAGLTPPPVLHGACDPMSLVPGNDNNNNASSDEAHALPASYQGIGFLPGTPLPQLFPPCDMMPIMHPSNTMLYQSSCNTSNQMSQTVLNSKDLQLQKSNTVCNPSSKRMMNEEDEGCLIPLASSSSLADKNSSHEVVGHEPVRTRVIKAKPYNPKSASESAARIFRSIQEERKHL